MPQFKARRLQPLSPRSIEASLKRGRALIEIIERYRDPQSVRELQQLPRAIHGLSEWARALSRRNRGVSVAEEIREENAAAERTLSEQ